MIKPEIIPSIRLTRQAMASNLMEGRTQDRVAIRGDNRDLEEYLLLLGGLTSFLGYVRKVKEDGLILDIGAGITKGVSELQKSPLGKGFDFEAVTLSYKSLIKKNLGRTKTHITSAERLRGIKDKSVAGIISVYGIAYSVSPELAASTMDRVLIPGGAIKAGFVRSGTDNVFHNSSVRSEEFAEIFSAFGYDVALDERYCDLLLAIKPGGPAGSLSAQELINIDSGTNDSLKRRHEEY